MSEAFRQNITAGDKAYAFYPINQIEHSEQLPYSLKILLENVLRCVGSSTKAAEMAQNIVDSALSGRPGNEIEFSPARVLFQDFTGVPVFVDLAAMRDACVELGGDPQRITPQIPCDLVIDHSVIADYAGCPESLERNTQLEYKRNRERYEFLKWAQASFDNVRIVPPSQGICHQLNIEQFAKVVMTSSDNNRFQSDRDPRNGGSGSRSLGEDAAENDFSTMPTAYFDTVVGTDSHTPTANGIGVLGWGVGGIEAEAAALGQPITTLVPRVIGIELTGSLNPGVMAMDVALTFAEKLRSKGVVGCFVECFGEGVAALSATQRACISNMTPEYGSTCTLFPVDDRTIEFLRMTGRDEDRLLLVESYAKAQGLWQGSDKDLKSHNRVYSEIINIDLSSIKPSMAGPSRPHDRFDIDDVRKRFSAICAERSIDSTQEISVDLSEGFADGCDDSSASHLDGGQAERYDLNDSCNLKNGAIAIAAITSCTTATDPAMMLQAGLIARNAAERGLRPKPWVKTILAPGSHSTETLLEQAGLLKPLQCLGFYTCGFGCMSCIGNSGPIKPALHNVSDKIELASVLSGNRNFEGRISPDVSQNYLTTPAHVIAFAIAGTVDFDPMSDPLGFDDEGNAVYLRDIEPDQTELEGLVSKFVKPDLYLGDSNSIYDGDFVWQGISAEASDKSIYSWDDASTYVYRPPYFDGMTTEAPRDSAQYSIDDAVALAVLGDFVTTDHISPAGAIALDMPAADYLREHGVEDADFNTYGSRRGNHEVMMRGTFANVKLQNVLAGGKLGGYTTDVLTSEPATIYEAAKHYQSEGVPAIVIAGRMYGSGSSRDWAAKGPMLLGIKAVIAESFERIHRSNLIGMGILPLQFEEGVSAASLGLDGTERFTISGITFSDGVPENEKVHVQAVRKDGSTVDFDVLVRIDTATEGKYYENNGILKYVLRDLASR